MGFLRPSSATGSTTWKSKWLSWVYNDATRHPHRGLWEINPPGPSYGEHMGVVP